MSTEQRIEQFRKMANDDPTNELGHFSLGKALLEAGRAEEAIAPLEKVIELKPRMSKAYQLLGEAMARSEQRGRAVEVTTRGVTIADEQGDRVPRDAMIDNLKSWGADVPKLKEAALPPLTGGATGAASAGFQCARCGNPSDQLEKPPFKGDLGRKVYENACRNCWREWIPMGTKVINELGLSLASPQGQEAYDQYMVEFLQLDTR